MKPAPLLVPSHSRFAGLWPAVLIVLAAAAAYANSFSCPFVFDDNPAIIDNATIRDLGNIRAVLSPPLSAAGATGRPLVNLSLAINYAFGQLDVRGYHAVNLCLHMLAALALFGVVRRTLERWSALSPTRSPVDGAAKRVGDNALHLALAITLLWAVHPLLTESVVCVIQRNEVLCGLFYLLTLYCFIRAIEVERVVPNALCSERERAVWYALSVLCCLLGMASKEVMASAPIMVLLYDRTFVSGSFRSAWSQRKKYYLALAATWLPLAWLMFGEHGRRQLGIGLGLGVSAWDYLLTQCRAITIYLKLCFWPHPLIVDYGDGVVHQLSAVLLPALGLCALFAATAVGVWKRRAWGFLGAWFFLILAPSSSVVPVITQTIAEHRMYLPLAAVVTLLVLMLQRVLGKFTLPALLLLAAIFGWSTFQRNEAYRTTIGIWSDTVANCPNNGRAHQSLGHALSLAGRMAESVAEYGEAVRLKPENAEAHYNLGGALNAEGRTAEAIEQCQEALRLQPNYPEAHNDLGAALNAEGRTAEAMGQYQEALRLKPDYAEAHCNLGYALNAEGRTAEAMGQYQEALRLKPDYVEAHNNLGNALGAEGRTDEAIAQYEEALRLKPDYAEAHNNLGTALSAEGRTDEAITQYEEATHLRPDIPTIHLNLAIALLKVPGRTDEAVTQLKTVLQLQPGNDAARRILAEIGALGP